MKGKQIYYTCIKCYWCWQ